MMHSAFEHLCVTNFDAKIHLFCDLIFDFLNHPMGWIVWKDEIRDSGQDEQAIEIGPNSFLQCWILYLHCHLLSRFKLCLVHLDVQMSETAFGLEWQTWAMDAAAVATSSIRRNSD